MKKKAAKKEVYLGIDQGSTATKVLVVTPEGKVLHRARKGVETIVSGAEVHQDPRALLRSVESALSESLAFSRDRNLAVRGAGLATQRSSFLFIDGEGRPLTPVVSWRDRSGADRLPSLATVRERIKEISGLPLTPHYSALKLLKYLPSRRSEVFFATVNTFLTYALTRGRVFATDPGNAQRTLLFDVSRIAYSEELLRYFSVPNNVRLPEVRGTASGFGIVAMGDMKIPLLASTGDQQAAFFGSSGWATGRGLINLGTGGFLLVPAAGRPEETGDLIVTLSHTVGGSPHFLLEGTVNAVGDALSYFETLLGRRHEVKVMKMGPYPAVVFGGHGTGAPLWDPPFPAALSGLTENTDNNMLLTSSLLGSLCYFRLIDEAITQLGWAVPGYVVSGGISAIDGVSRFLRDLLGKPVFRSKSSELTGIGAALSGMVFHDSRPLPQRKGDFVRFAGKAPTDAGAYYAEWLKLYHLARRGAGR